MSKDKHKDRSEKSDKALRQVANLLQLNKIERHLFLCLGDKCCESDDGNESWSYLKHRVKELGLGDEGFFRSKVGCLRVCRDGPVGVVYPDGIWYRSLTPDNIERVLQEHIRGGKPVEDLVFARNAQPAVQPPH